MSSGLLKEPAVYLPVRRKWGMPQEGAPATISFISCRASVSVIKHWCLISPSHAASLASGPAHRHYIRAKTRPQRHEKEMCASIHLSFKMEALKNSSSSTRRARACALKSDIPTEKLECICPECGSPFWATRTINNAKLCVKALWSFMIFRIPGWLIICCVKMTLHAVKTALSSYRLISGLFSGSPYRYHTLTPPAAGQTRSKCENANQPLWSGSRAWKRLGPYWWRSPRRPTGSSPGDARAFLELHLWKVSRSTAAVQTDWSCKMCSPSSLTAIRKMSSIESWKSPRSRLLQSRYVTLAARRVPPHRGK